MHPESKETPETQEIIETAAEHGIVESQFDRAVSAKRIDKNNLKLTAEALIEYDRELDSFEFSAVIRELFGAEGQTD